MLVLRRLSTLRSCASSLHVAHRGFSSWMPRAEGNESVHCHLLSLCKEGSEQNLEGLRIEVVDDDSWHVSAGLAEVWKGNEKDSNRKLLFGEEEDDEVASYIPPDKEDPDCDDIEDMRIRGGLFYKVDKDSKEYEEYNVDFPRKRSPKGKAEQKEKPKDSKKKDEFKVAKKEKMNADHKLEEKRVQILGFCEMGGNLEGKRLRNPTFNQLTGPYHEPFCLDIYVSKGSVRASVIHRATSKVVAVAHSISKDMKFDLGSTKSNSTCVAVGEVLAQRALADDIHNVMYTPRKGDRLEGKLQIVLDSIIDHGVSVKLKLKQRKARKGGLFEPRSQII